MTTALLVTFLLSCAAILLGWAYFRRWAITRPPIGVFNLTDVVVMMGFIVLIPYLYLALPVKVLAAVLTLGTISILYFVLEPVLVARWAVWTGCLLVAGADIGALIIYGWASRQFFAVNDAVLVIVAAGVANLWAQSGMKARDAAVLGGALTIYDLVSTSILPLMGDLMASVSNLPFAPMAAWAAGKPAHWAGIGLGDMLLAAAFPLVMRKAFGRDAGATALIVGIAAIGCLLASFGLGLLRHIFPAMVILGPAMALQYTYWRRRCGTERTTWQYLKAEPLRSGQVVMFSGAADCEEGSACR